MQQKSSIIPTRTDLFANFLISIQSTSLLVCFISLSSCLNIWSAFITL